MVGLSGCASDTDSDTQVSSRAYSMQMKQNQNRVLTFNGRRQIRSSDGSMWTPPAGSYQDKDGYILDKDGTTIGQTFILGKCPDIEKDIMEILTVDCFDF